MGIYLDCLVWRGIFHVFDRRRDKSLSLSISCFCGKTYISLFDDVVDKVLNVIPVKSNHTWFVITFYWPLTRRSRLHINFHALWVATRYVARDLVFLERAKREKSSSPSDACWESVCGIALFALKILCINMLISCHNWAIGKYTVKIIALTWKDVVDCAERREYCSKVHVFLRMNNDTLVMDLIILWYANCVIFSAR